MVPGVTDFWGGLNMIWPRNLNAKDSPRRESTNGGDRGRTINCHKLSISGQPEANGGETGTIG